MPVDLPPGDRPSADDRSEVHFVRSGPEPGGFEELPSNGPAPRRRVLLVVAAVVVGLGLVAAVVARVATASSDIANGPTTVTASPPTASARPSTPTPGTSSREAPFALPSELPFLSELTRAEIGAARAECPRLAQVCTPTGEVPSGVRNALRARFPHVKDLVAVSDIAYSGTSGPRLAYRRVSARSGELRITVEVRQAGAPVRNSGISLTTAGQAMVRLQRAAGRFVVEAQLTSPHPRAPSAGGLSDLVRDPRLLAVG